MHGLRDGTLAGVAAATALALIAGCAQKPANTFQGYIEGALRSGYRCASEVAGPS